TVVRAVRVADAVDDRHAGALVVGGDGDRVRLRGVAVHVLPLPGSAGERIRGPVPQRVDVGASAAAGLPVGDLLHVAGRVGRDGDDLDLPVGQVGERPLVGILDLADRLPVDVPL